MPFTNAESSENSKVGAIAVRKLLCLSVFVRSKLSVYSSLRDTAGWNTNTGRAAPTLLRVGSVRNGADEIVAGGGAPSTAGIVGGITGTGAVGSPGGSDRMVGVSGSAGGGGSTGSSGAVGAGGGAGVGSGSEKRGVVRGGGGCCAATSTGKAPSAPSRRTTETRTTR